MKAGGRWPWPFVQNLTTQKMDSITRFVQVSVLSQVLLAHEIVWNTAADFLIVLSAFLYYCKIQGTSFRSPLIRAVLNSKRSIHLML